MTGPDATAPPATATAPGATGWRRLNPRMLLVHPVQEVIRAWPLLLGLVVAGSRGNPWWTVGGVVMAIVLGTSRWFTTTYRITPEQVQVRRGLLRRQVLTVPRARVRSVDVTAHAMHRVLGLARVSVGTGRSDQQNDGLKLDGLDATDAARLHEELLHRPAGTGSGPVATAAPEAPAPTPEVELARLRPGWLRYGPFTLYGLVVVGVVAGFLSRVVNEAHIDVGRLGAVREATTQAGRAPLWLLVVVVVVVVGLFVAGASTAGYLLAFFNFRLSRHPGGTLHVRRGLVTTRATTIEERRLRGAELSEPLLLRAVGGARLLAITTGLRVGRGAERGGTVLLPPAPAAEAVGVAAAVLNDPRPLAAPLTGHGPRARRRRYTRALAGAAVVVAGGFALGTAGYLPSWSWEWALLVVPVALALAFDRYRSLGHALLAGRLVSRRGSLVRRRSALACEGIIGFNVRQSYFQRRAGLATLTATTAAGRQRYPVPDVDMAAALRLAEAARPGLLTPFLESATVSATPPTTSPAGAAR